MQKISILSISLAVAILTGCTGSDDENSGTGYYIDSAVSGVEYSCGSQNGKTGSDGNFTFEKGKDCIFSLGSMKLREVNADTLKDKIKILEDNLVVATLLQTLDSDGDPDNDGIVISENILAELREKNIITLPVNQDEVAAIYEAIKNVDGYQGSLKTEEEAQAHLERVQYSILREYGTYTDNGGEVIITKADAGMNRASPPEFQFNLKYQIGNGHQDRDNVQITTQYHSPSEFDNALVNNSIVLTESDLYVGMEIFGEGWVGNDSISDDFEVTITKNSDGTYSLQSQGTFTSRDRVISDINAIAVLLQ